MVELLDLPARVVLGRSSKYSTTATTERLDPIVSQWSKTVSLGFSSLFLEAFSRIDAFAALGDNWDGYGALPISDAVIANARFVLERLSHSCPTPDVVPNSNGTISFEWETRSAYAYLEVGATRYALVVDAKAGQGGILADGYARSFDYASAKALCAALSPPRNAAPTITRIQIGSDVLLAT